MYLKQVHDLPFLDKAFLSKAITAIVRQARFNKHTFELATNFQVYVLVEKTISKALSCLAVVLKLLTCGVPRILGTPEVKNAR